MKLSEIVNQLAATLPLYTPLFSRNLVYKNIKIVNGTVIVETDKPHKLNEGTYITFSGMSITRNVKSLKVQNNRGVAIVDGDHDLTDNYQASVTFSGCSKPEFNGTFEFLHQPNRYTIEFVTPSYYPPADTTGMVFYANFEVGLNGTYPIHIISDTSFEVTLADTSINAQTVNAKISTGQRVIGTVNLDRFLEMYEAKDKNTFWAVVCMETASTSKSRDVTSDSIGHVGTSSVEYRQILLEPFSVYVVAPSTETLAAVSAIDLCYSEIRNAIFHSILGKAFESGLDASPLSGAMLLAHGNTNYSRAYYIHQYSFETRKEITLQDTVLNNSFENPTRAFRDLVLDFDNETELDQDINLDDVPFKQ